MRKYRYYLRYFLYKSCYLAADIFIKVKRFFLGDYYTRLGVQARYLYRQSELFKIRWQEFGLDYAENSFDNDLGGVGQHFFWKARHSPWPIKKRIILDWLLKRPAQPYALSEEYLELYPGMRR